jgi:flagellar hook assembly protein FlgD
MLVMTLDGKVVKKIESQGINIDGDQLIWDGKDSEGDYVSSGVYLLAIYGENGSNQMEKITVIKK